jgi:hypothetical protein
MRPVDAALVGLGAFMGRRIQEVSPRDMAERKLRTSCAHYSDGQMADFMALFDETMRNMDGGAS